MIGTRNRYSKCGPVAFGQLLDAALLVGGEVARELDAQALQRQREVRLEHVEVVLHAVR